jgi:predicted amidohydrolase YtcJ
MGTSADTPYNAVEGGVVGDWLEAYTSGAAFADGQEDEPGSITPGNLADLVVLDRADTGARVLQTWKRGDLVHSH